LSELLISKINFSDFKRWYIGIACDNTIQTEPFAFLKRGSTIKYLTAVHSSFVRFFAHSIWVGVSVEKSKWETQILYQSKNRKLIYLLGVTRLLKEHTAVFSGLLGNQTTAQMSTFGQGLERWRHINPTISI